MTNITDIAKHLPQFNCGACGYKTCNAFANAVANAEANINSCPVLNQERFKTQKQYLLSLDYSPQTSNTISSCFKGLIDKANADFLLHPLKGEPSCRETLACFAHIELKPGMILKYRPLGCPITHFATILEVKHGLADVWVTGPPALLNNYNGQQPVDVGICMVLSFQGQIETQANHDYPAVGKTVKFLPAHCMMGKIHSGVIVSMEGNMARIDCIDLKIWEHSKD
ncbi:MAG: (Fe-S)-binding protein [Bacteroidales bacterium]|jgi:uncharacterized Fe-S cluster-containing protein|nr:(Fe-S)-binding protein [Bacteroidales bacterium]MDD3300417.1 (Fe-S)-binding protein [Bacteroidales bacterium]MDD3844384.1 (Fe-S)-binding protein [Bacteroidales bacterium]MDD4618913.1 (Fe-S)-binding protein [Bacteroidales bacterium]